MNDLKDILTRVADVSATAPLSLDDVRTRARRIRRRRTASAVVACAAAVAAIVGVGVAVGPSDSRGGVDPAKSPSATATPTVSAEADDLGPVYAFPADPLGVGQTFNDAPQVPIWHSGGIEDVDGSTTPLPDRPLAFAWDRAKEAWAVVRAGETHAELVWVDRDGDVLGSPLPTFEHGLAVGPAHQLVTLTEQDGAWVLTEAGRTVPLGRSLEHAQIDGVLPNGDVLVESGDGTVRVAQFDVGEAGRLPGAGTVRASTGSGTTAYGLADGSWRGEDTDGNTRWTLDWAGVSSFSPDGRYVVLTGDPKKRIPGSQDWDSDHATGVLWIRDAETLAPVGAFVAPRGGYFWGWAWEDDHLLATVHSKDGSWDLARLARPAGTTVARGGRTSGDGEEPAYVLAKQ